MPIRLYFACSLLWGVLFAVGCGPALPTPEQIAQQVQEKIRMPPIAQAKTIRIVCSPPGDTPERDAFARSVSEALAERINTQGFRSSTEDASQEAALESLPQAFLSSEQEWKEADQQADVTVCLKVDAFKLEGTFALKEVRIHRQFDATLLLYAKDAESPYTVRTTYELSMKGNPPETLEVNEVPSWTQGGYPEDEKSRLDQYAKECAERTLESLISHSASGGK